MLTKPIADRLLDREIAKTLALMDHHSPTSEEYNKHVDRVSQLQKLKNDNRSSRISPDTLALCLSNLLGIMLIIRHEHLNVITSKAASFVIKPK